MTVRDRIVTLERARAGETVLVAAGDAIWNRNVSRLGRDDTKRLFELLGTGDIGVLNLEMTITDIGYPRPKTVTRADPAIADELAWAGFDVVSLANNHAMDYGIAGLERMRAILEARNIRHTGAGESTACACRPALVERNGHRIAVLGFMAVPDDEIWGALAHADAAGVAAIRGYEVVLPDGTVALSPLASDLEAMVRAVAAARRDADFLLVSLHHHWGDLEAIDTAQRMIAHRALDAGADIVVGHGPHILNGVEIYDEKPILYSLGNLFFQMEPAAYELFPQDPALIEWLKGDQPIYENVVVRMILTPKARLRALEFIPVELADDGTPALASRQFAERVLDRLDHLSAPFGTFFVRADGSSRLVFAE